MSFAVEHVRSVDGQLEQLILSKFAASRVSENDVALQSRSTSHIDANSGDNKLHSLIRSLSIGSSTQAAIQKPSRLLDALAVLSPSDGTGTLDGSREENVLPYDDELRWFGLAKITNHAYGLALQALISQTLPLNDDLLYWDDVLSSPLSLAIYSAQASPLRLWDWSGSIYEEVSRKGIVLTDGWRQFYGHVRSVARERSLANVQRRISAPWALIADSVRSKSASLRRAKSINAGAIGYLLSQRIDYDSVDNHTSNEGSSTDWGTRLARNVAAIDSTFAAVRNGNEMHNVEFEEVIATLKHHDMLNRQYSDVDDATIRGVVCSLQNILGKSLPAFTQDSRIMLAKNSKPSRIIRYWIPATLALVFSGTVLRVVANRKADVVTWIRELGATAVDFWRNWVIDPTRKIIGTIRHDEASEVSIMSKRSLEGDRESLERMVVDFAVDNRKGPGLSSSEIKDLKASVHEGDLTPVLMAYEQDLKSPLYGSVRGNLIRALLIQIQKTKVDVEIAIGGIDNLLKSQELVFGFVGLTPGVLVCVGLFRWLGSFSTTRRELRRGRKQSQSYKLLRNIDRILTSSPQSDTGVLSSKDYGLVVCEAIVLRDIAQRTFPKDTFREFVQDFNDLIDNDSGVGRQIRVADRIRWAYSRWL